MTSKDFSFLYILACGRLPVTPCLPLDMAVRARLDFNAKQRTWDFIKRSSLSPPECHVLCTPRPSVSVWHCKIIWMFAFVYWPATLHCGDGDGSGGDGCCCEVVFGLLWCTVLGSLYLLSYGVFCGHLVLCLLISVSPYCPHCSLRPQTGIISQLLHLVLSH